MTFNRNLISELIAEAKADEVGLWLIIAKLRDEYGITERPLIRTAALDCVRALLESGQVVAGYYHPDGGGIAVWDIPVPDIISRIDMEWDNLKDEPSIGDIVIFVGRSQTYLNP